MAGNAGIPDARTHIWYTTHTTRRAGVLVYLVVYHFCVNTLFGLGNKSDQPPTSRSKLFIKISSCTTVEQSNTLMITSKGKLSNNSLCLLELLDHIPYSDACTPVLPEYSSRCLDPRHSLLGNMLIARWL